MSNEPQRPPSSRPSGYIFADTPKLKTREYQTKVSPGRVAIAGALMALFFYVLIVIGTLAPDSQEFFTRAFGATPFGFPVTAVVLVVMTVLLLPFLLGMFHLGRIL